MFLQEVHIRKEPLHGTVFVLQLYRLWGNSLFRVYSSNNEDCQLYSTLHDLSVSRQLQKQRASHKYDLLCDSVYSLSSSASRNKTRSGDLLLQTYAPCKDKGSGVCLLRCIAHIQRCVCWLCTLQSLNSCSLSSPRHISSFSPLGFPSCRGHLVVCLCLRRVCASVFPPFCFG